MLSYQKFGSVRAKKSTLVLLHGWGGQWKSWFPVIEALKAHYQLIVPDLPGFGETPLEQPMMLNDYANEVVVMLTILKLKSVVLVGHSFGGAVAMKIASQRPELVNRLIIIDSSGIRPKRSFGVNMWISMVKVGNMVLELPGLEKIRQKVRRGLYSVGSLKNSDYAVLRDPKMKQTFESIITDDISDDVTRITCPTTLIWGSDDKDTPLWMGERFHALIPQSELVVLHSAGHFSYLDQGVKFVDLIRERVG